MLKYYPHIILLLLISACSSSQKTNYAPVIETSKNYAQAIESPVSIEKFSNTESQLANQWQLSYFDEPIFNSKIAILETGNINKQPIILIHGLGQLGMKDWFSIIPSLEKKYHVIALDLPGFGLSVNAKGRFLPTNYARVIEAVSKKYTNQKAIIIGHSMGGAVALRYTALFPKNVKQLILVDAAGLLEKSAFIKHIAAFEFGNRLPLFVQQQVDKVNEFSSSMIETTTQSNLLTNFLQENDYAWNWLVSDSTNMNAALSLVEEDFSQAVQEITVPVDIIWGEEDKVAPLRTGKVLSKQMKNTRLQIIKGAGHVPMKSNHSQFMEALYIALTTPVHEQNILSKNTLNKGLLFCQGEQNKIYTGYYDRILIENCNNIQLINVETKDISIKNSAVNIEGLTFNSQKNKIDFYGSVINITNADISGNDPLFISSTRLDMAGVSIQATGDALSVGNKSRISASFSDINSPSYSGNLHGLFYLSNQLLTVK